MGAPAALGITLEEFERLPGDGVQHEISAGRLITMPPPHFSHAKVALSVLKALLRYLAAEHWEVIPEAGYVLCSDPLTVRQPDLSVLSKKRFDTTKRGYCTGAPELAIEVISPSDDEDEIKLKIAQYLQYGTIEVWVLYPTTRQVQVFRADGGSTVLNASDTLDGGPVLPGFSIAVSDLFTV